jgi:hypothetical protein
MANTRNSTGEQDRPMIYQIRLQGHLGRQWADWFGGLNITLEDNGETLIAGPVADQSALYGLLKKVRDLGLTLVSVMRIEPDRACVSDQARTGNPIEDALNYRHNNHTGGTQ